VKRDVQTQIGIGRRAAPFLDNSLPNPYNNLSAPEKRSPTKTLKRIAKQKSEIAPKIEPNRLDKAKLIPYNNKAAGNSSPENEKETNADN
jgi:hypothetical protein